MKMNPFIFNFAYKFYYDNKTWEVRLDRLTIDTITVSTINNCFGKCYYILNRNRTRAQETIRAISEALDDYNKKT